MKTANSKSFGLQLVLINIVFWVLLTLPAFLFRYNGPSNNFSEYYIYRSMINNTLLAVIFYANAYYFYPSILKRKRLILYLLVIAVSLMIVWFLSQYVDQQLFPVKRKWGKPFFPNFISYVFIIGTSCSYRIIIDSIKSQTLNKDRENENLKTELSFLRSQVSPHFMFNVLNNLVALARKKSDKIESSLIQLSNLLRYMLYEGDDGKISIKQELKYLQGYIDLQRLRFEDDVKIIFRTKGNPEDFYLEPMLLIPFVENAFKHGMGGDIINPTIKIELILENDGLNFTVENEIGATGDSKDNSSGIGLNNAKRRLNLLYKNNYSLDIKNDGFKYSVNLKLRSND
ncbi:histidine kinase [Pedobacter sp. SD-b]|uniref:Histidine kinase n=1 Tax=Pedobacter segetis TaxID=2793069 RepID=A0ABS1BHY1_9SPHI|nr:histidine kinase [Pedobacter segetis]MBK0381971.1 histidine kinase [Pedobacter segetis]